MMFRNENGSPDAWRNMPNFQILVVNSDFTARNEIEAEDVDAARRHGLRAALEIGTDELCKGSTPVFGAEVKVERHGEPKERFMVVLGQTPLS